MLPTFSNNGEGYQALDQATHFGDEDLEDLSQRTKHKQTLSVWLLAITLSKIFL